MRSGTPSNAKRRLTIPRNVGLAVIVLGLLGLVFLFTRINQSDAEQHQIEQGEQLAESGKMDEAEHLLSDVTRRDPDNVFAWEILAKFYVNSHRYDAAVEPLRHMARLAPENPEVHGRLAQCLQRASDPMGALQEAREALKRNPNDITGLTVASDVLEQIGEQKQQLEYERRLVQLKPDSVEMLTILALALVRVRYYEEALPVVEKILQLEPNSLQGNGLHGTILYYTDPTPVGLARAQVDLQKALAINSNALPPNLYLGRTYTRLNQPQKALPYLEKALAIAPDSADAEFALAEAYDRAGDKARAEEARNRFMQLREAADRELALEKRCASRPDSFEDHLELGKIKLQKHDLKAATYYLQQALHLHPDDSAARAAVQELTTEIDAMRASSSPTSGGP